MDELTPDEQRYFTTKGTVAPNTAAAAPSNAELPEQHDETDAEPGEGATEDDGGAQPKPEEPREARRVPLAELLSERERRRNAESELARNRARLNAIESQLATVATDEGELPDGAKDPEGYAKAVAARAERHKAALQNLRAAAESRARELEIGARAMGIYHAQVDEFARRQPDYDQAYKHLVADREAELATLGYADPIARLHMVAQEEAAIVARALADGANPAERIYAVARRRGYKPGGGDGEKLLLAERGQAAGKSLGSAPGGATRVVSPEALASLDDADFAQATSGANWKRLWQ
jgi:hypothetical protein